MILIFYLMPYSSLEHEGLFSHKSLVTLILMMISIDNKRALKL